MLNRPIEAAGVFLAEFNFITVGTLIVSLLAMIASFPKLRDNFSLGAWIYVLLLSIPFLGMIRLLDPFGHVPVG